MRRTLPWRAAFDVVFPEGILLLLVIALLERGVLDASLAGVTRVAPYVVLAAGLLLAWRFHHGRILVGLVVLALADRALLHLVPDLTAGPGNVLLQAVALVVPLNLAGLAVAPERGVFTRTGAVWWAVVAAQGALIAGAALVQPATTLALLDPALLPSRFSAWTSLGEVPLLAFAVAAIVLVVQVVLRPSATGRGLLWALIATGFALHAIDNRQAAEIYFTCAGLVLVVAVVEASYSMAYRDALTGLPARRAFDDALRRLGSRYVVAMVDIDRFKGINDRFGHDVGDQVLRMVATKLRAVGGGGRTFRYGGEEFAVLFPGKTVEECLAHLKDAHRTIADARFTVRSPDRPRKRPKRPTRGRGTRKTLSVTVSIGVAAPSEREPEAAEVVNAADGALYRAKRAGRNRIKTPV